MDPFQIINKYYEFDTSLYRILVEHSVQVKEKALQVAEKHTNLQIDKVFMAEAAMLHDIGIFKCHAPGICCVGTHQYIEHGYLGAQLLRTEGLERHALVCERHTGTGITQEMIVAAGLPIPPGDYEPVSMEEQIICYADKFFSKSKLGIESDLNKILRNLSKHGESQVERFLFWHRMFE